jgi:zinc D-Ala-D-Ala carboxypeptidase
MSYWSFLRGRKQPAPAPAPEPEPAPVLEYASWELVPPSVWVWPNFRPRELACKGTGRIRLQRKAVSALQDLRQAVGKPMTIASAYRSAEHNAKVGGAKNSRHMFGDAFDVVMTGHDPHAFEAAARKAGFTGFGYYPGSTPPFMHIDMGPTRTWGTPFSKRNTSNEA